MIYNKGYIKTDTGWKIVLGREIDIFHKTQGKFDIAELNQEQRQCKACEITYLRTILGNSLKNNSQCLHPNLFSNMPGGASKTSY
jgi:hypothetical protein